MIDIPTQKIIKKIAEIQLEALNSLKNLLVKNKLLTLEEMQLLKSIGVDMNYDLEEEIDAKIAFYSDLVDTPSTIKLLNKYQLLVCHHILFKMEDEWIIDNQEGVYGAWQLIHYGLSKLQPELDKIWQL